MKQKIMKQAQMMVKRVKIAIVTSPSGVDDGNFNEDNYNGILSLLKKFRCDCKGYS